MATYVIGDLHGHLRDYERLLKQSGLCDENLDWTGGNHTLWLMGDFFDRGASGIGCVDLTMKLQHQAEAAGGLVNSLLGNHELMILCAYHFRETETGAGETVMDQWLRWGGIESDLVNLSDEQAAWIAELPAMVVVENALMIHADSMLYVNRGFSPEQVNESYLELMKSRELPAWETALSEFNEHMAFCELEMTGKRRAEQLLKLYGGDYIIHGHTPIPFARRIEPESVTEAWRYAGGKCLNVDGGMYMGSPGFVHQLV